MIIDSRWEIQFSRVETRSKKKNKKQKKKLSARKLKNETKFEQDNKKKKNNKKRTGKWRRNNVDKIKKGDFARTHRERERRKTGGRMKKEGSCWPTLRQPTTRWQGACSRRYYFHFSSPMRRSPFLLHQPEKKKRKRISFFLLLFLLGRISSSRIEEKTQG